VSSFIIAIDILLLLYFVSQGIKSKNRLVIFFALTQLVLYFIVLSLDFFTFSDNFLLDKVSFFMLLVVNIVGLIIILYATTYIQDEKFSKSKKINFILILFFFLAVMNLTVSTNNLEIFFLGFELTTLCSYLLIRYRGDTLSQKNALQALWMNQIGGVAILISLIVSIIYYDTVYLDILLKSIDGTFLLPIVFLILAAFVKGASIPFHPWLLGAMVAPTPVSAILHSATMVKLAPYLILKLSPAFSPTLSVLVMLFGSFVFMGASILALGKDYFKEILGLSTVALLALMMAIAAIGTPEAIDICLILIVFHAISKALLFLQAGILEKVFHLKYLQDINYLVNNSKLVVFFIIIGFGSLTLPPFGAFIGKFNSIELIASLIGQNILYLFSLVFILLGSVCLTLLYFKVLTKLLATKNQNSQKQTDIGLVYKFTSWSLVLLLIIGTYICFEFAFLTIDQIIVPSFLIVVTLILFYTSSFKYAHRVKEYNCGEKDELSLSAYYFDIDNKYKKLILTVSIILICLIILGGF